MLAIKESVIGKEPSCTAYTTNNMACLFRDMAREREVDTMWR